MGYAIPLKRIGAHVLDQITRARDAFSGAPDGGPFPVLRRAEISVAFATADGLPIEPALVVVGDAPIPPEEALRRLDALDRRVLVALSDIEHASAGARGRLVMRIAF
jgi:hypothetical protein